MRSRRGALIFLIGIAIQLPCLAQEPSALAVAGKQFALDERGLWTSPLHIDRDNLKWLAPLAAGTAALLATDHRVSGEVQENTSLRIPSHIVSNAASLPLLSMPVALMAAGRFTNDGRMFHAGSVGLQVFLHSEIIVQTLKLATNRERPDKLRGDGGFWDGGKSFPSGHAISAWALATAISDQYPDKKWVGIGSYTMASAVGLSRIGGLNHFPSDVLIGSSLGLLIGHYVSRRHR